MFGMIKKDLLMVKNNYKAILVSLVIFIFYSIYLEMDMSFFLPFMGLMLCISTINYDEYNNWHTYATTLPQGKINIVKSKYITTIGVTIMLTIISIILNFALGTIRGTLNIEETLKTLMIGLVSIMFMMSILFPVLLKYGSEKGRMAMIIIGLGIFGIVLLLKNMIDVEIPNNIINFLDSYLPIILLFVSAISVIISYFIAKKIYLNREF